MLQLFQRRITHTHAHTHIRNVEMNLQTYKTGQYLRAINNSDPSLLGHNSSSFLGRRIICITISFYNVYRVVKYLRDHKTQDNLEGYTRQDTQ